MNRRRINEFGLRNGCVPPGRLPSAIRRAAETVNAAFFWGVLLCVSLPQAASAVCGDNVCAAPETTCNCPNDCGSPSPQSCSIFNTQDQDCDGMVGCNDPDCISLSGPFPVPCANCPNGTCSACERCGGCAACAADCGTPPASETNCSDGIDEDCSGTADCSDVQCLSFCCGNGTCDAADDHCNCSTDCGAAPASEINCIDGRDNDCNGLVDCLDSVCFSQPVCCGNAVCSPWENSCNCTADCGPPAGMETACADGLDDDCDGFFDCADADCQTGTETTCGDLVDNDCDGFADCGDSDCFGVAACCGDKVCSSPPENSCNCPGDCGPPPSEDCNNFVDDNCDGMSGCADYDDCSSVFGVSCNLGNTCGNSTCTPSERCSGSCPQDCGPPLTSEVSCTNGLDDDCNGTADCADVQCLPVCCGNGTCDPAETFCNCVADCGMPLSFEAQCHDARDNDCDGFIDCADSECQTGSETDCTDGIDDDCDGDIDCDDDDCMNLDADNDGFAAALCGGPDCDDADPQINPNAVENCTDGIDSDCDGFDGCLDADCVTDADNDGVAAAPCGNDCDDNDSTRYPFAPEICNNGQDNDCDPFVDCADPDCFGDPVCCGDGTCDTFEGLLCTCAADCGNPTASEVGLCFDNRDNDCDGVDDCSDRDCCLTEPSCHILFGCGDGSCQSNQGENRCSCQCDCGAPPATETACSDNQDEDCDGAADCDDADCQGVDADDDGFIDATCGGNDCDDSDPDINPNGVESCTDGADNDCDNGTDCFDTECHGDDACEACCLEIFDNPFGCTMAATGSCPNGSMGAGTFCDAPVACCYFFSSPFGGFWTCGDFSAICCNSSLGPGSTCATRPQNEAVCNDGIDDECDGLLDCGDPDCQFDSDMDGYDSVPCGDDCDDADPSVNPGEAEVCGDGIDNDCDALLDCDDSSECTLGVYGDLDGDGDVDVDDLLCMVYGYSNLSLCPSGDIDPCKPDGDIDVDDLLAIVFAYGGTYACAHPCTR